MSSNHTKLRREDHKGLESNPTEGINESVHGLEGIDDLANKNRVFSIDEKLKNLVFKELVIPRGFALGNRD